jgi:hypothetical protein
MSDIQRAALSELFPPPKSSSIYDEGNMQSSVRQDIGLPIYGELAASRSGRQSAPLPQTSTPGSMAHSPCILGRHNSFQTRYGGHEVAPEKVKRTSRPFVGDLVGPVDLSGSACQQVRDMPMRRKPHPGHALSQCTNFT